jgi:hypothetical protein
MLNWLRKANKTGSGYGSGFLGIADEVFAPMKYELQQDRDRKTSLASPAPRNPENGVQARDDADVRFAGRIRIDPGIASA